MIKISHVSKIYQTGPVETLALSDVSFEVKTGEFVAIMGPSGSGKSTLMHIIGALDKPTSGTYILDGVNVESLPDDQLAEIRNRKIGFIFQAFNLLPRTSALKNVMLPMAYAGIPKSEREQRAEQSLNLVDLGDRISHTSSQLSEGQQQRVAIARSLVLNPAILLADEPTGNIASAQAEEIMAIFKRLNTQGHTIVIITHEPDIAAYAKRVIHIKDGKIISDENKFLVSFIYKNICYVKDMSKTNQPKNIFKNAIEEIINKKLDSLKEETAMQFAQIDKRFNDQELKADERHDIVMRALDAVMGMFKNHSEEHVLLSDQQRRVNESNDRLDRLEKIHPHGQHAI